MSESENWSIVLLASDLPDQVSRFLDKTPAEIKRGAFTAGNNYDSHWLCELQKIYLIAMGARGSNISLSTLRTYQSFTKQFINYCKNNAINVIRVTYSEASIYRSHLEKQGVLVMSGPYKGNRRGCPRRSLAIHLTSIRSLYKALIWCGVCDSSVFDKIKLRKVTYKPGKRPYFEDELRQLICNSTPLEKIIVLLGAHGGLRSIEALGLEYSDIDFSKNTITIRNGKGKKQRTIPLSSTLASALLLNAAGQKKVLPYFTTSWLRIKLKMLCKKLGVEYLGYHSLRRYSGTRLYKEIGDLNDVAHFLGHNNIETARMYVQYSDEWNNEPFEM